MTHRPSLRIEGNHSRYHGGSAAVIRALRAIAVRKGWRLVGRDEKYDAMLMNGEGSMHHGARDFHRKMNKLASAIAAGKPGFLVNTVWQDNPNDYDDILRNLSGVSARDIISQQDLLERHGIAARLLPDISCADPLPRWTLRRNYRGTPAVTDFWFPDKARFAEGYKMFPDAGRLPFRRWSWGRAIASMNTASYLITGRQHAVYAACRARTPFIASEGNTHKIAGFIKTAGVDIPVATHPAELNEMRQVPEKHADEYRKLFAWLDSVDFSVVVPAPGEIWQVRA